MIDFKEYQDEINRICRKHQVKSLTVFGSALSDHFNESSDIDFLLGLKLITNRKKSNLSRTLKTLEKYGIVELQKTKGKIQPKVKATDFRVEFGLHYSSPVPH